MLTWQGFNPDWWFPTVSPVLYTEAVTGTLYAIFHHSFFWNILLRAHFAIARLPRSILRKNTGDWPGPVCWLNSLCDWTRPVVGAGWQEVPPNLVTGCRTSFKVLWWEENWERYWFRWFEMSVISDTILEAVAWCKIEHLVKKLDRRCLSSMLTVPMMKGGWVRFTLWLNHVTKPKCTSFSYNSHRTKILISGK